MFQLIVAVISIALVAALAIASIFYGGDAFTKSSEKANVTTLVNQGQQISAAAQLYKTDKAAFPSNGVAGLVSGGYLSVVPAPSKLATGSWTIVTNGRLTYALVRFADGVDRAAICHSGDTGEEEIDVSIRGEVLKQGGTCRSASGGGGNTHFAVIL